MFGDLADSGGKPVLVVRELMSLKDKSGVTLDEIKVASTYGKTLINRSNILYIEPNKKRTERWLASNRLQLPLDATISVQ